MMQLDALSVTGARGRAACARLAALSNDLAAALRRAAPFLSRRRVAISVDVPRCTTFADLAVDLSIVHAAAFEIRAVGETAGSNVRGLVLVDEVALARILDGVLGGGAAETRSSGEAKLTPARGALASRVSSTMIRAFGEVLSTRLGLTVSAIAQRDSAKLPEIEPGAAVAVTLALDGGGRVLLALPLSTIPGEQQPAGTDRINERIASAMMDVEIDVVAVLGKVRLPLEQVASLAVGDVLRLSLSLDERARVCAGGAVLFHGRPTASGHVVGVVIERREDGS
jgi:flagellar motor switch protein FliM